MSKDELSAGVSADAMMPVYLAGRAGFWAAAGDFLKIDPRGVLGDGRDWHLTFWF